MIEKIGADVAEQEFQRFADAMDLDISPEPMDDEDRAGFEKQKRRIIRAMVAGALVIDEDGQPVFTPQASDSAPVTFHEPDGAALMSMDKRKKGEDMGKMMAIMGAITKTNAKTFSAMKQRDLNVCIAITTLFLG